ncbi:DUF4198 domain-containing protein [Ramlibacter albus]|uniref:DUF4198 domain-containing protein n=1 Tax=Ramlibacter albus TaxID=2079448 RepID=A0A923M958_9BURK|nr:DUF4198 domain-containing protein [Ramlibacter albus]
MKKFLAAAAAALLIAGAAADAAAHDTWLARGAEPGRVQLLLSTGNRFPIAEFAPPVSSIERAGCTDASGAVHNPNPVGDATAALRLVLAPRDGQALACHVQLVPFDIELTPQLVEVYLREIRAPDSVRSAWEQMRKAGKPWRERYVKFARIELATAAGDESPAQWRTLREATPGAPLEIVPGGTAPLQAGREAVFRVLASGRPVRDVPVELVSDRSPVGVWLRSDADGLLRVTIPFAADWLLRATVLDLAGDAWNSRFATFAFTARAPYAAPAAADSRPRNAMGFAARP